MSARPGGAMWNQFFQRWSGSGLSLQGQIRQMLVAAILDGQLPLAAPIPSSREMSTRLGVARNTVVIAYQQLVDEGYLLSHERKGHFINPAMLLGRASRPVEEAQLDDGLPVAPPDWSRRFRFRPSVQRNIDKRADWQCYPYPFIYGQFDAALFPVAEWRECCLKTLSVLEIGEWAQDMILRDDDSLVRQIRTRVLPRRGIWAAEDEVVITVGAQQALYLLADLLVRPDTVVGIEDPGYPDARNIFSSRSEHMVALPLDEHGLQIGEALSGCDYVYVTPSHQCPTTVRMPLARREALLRQAGESDFVLIEDDYESENRVEGEPVPTLKSLDRSNRVIYVGSLSKSLAPGLRLGYVVGPAELLAELRGIRRLNLRHPTAYMQRAFALFLSLGHHNALLRRLSTAHRERAQALTEALARHLPEVRHVPISGGSSCWVEGPKGLDDAELTQRAQGEGVLIEPGSVFFMSETPPKHYFRLGYSAIATEAIEPGIARLAKVFRSLARDPPVSISSKNIAGPNDSSQLALSAILLVDYSGNTCPGGALHRYPIRGPHPIRETAMSQPNVQFLMAFGEAWNRHDIDALMSMMAEECTFHVVAGPDVMGKSFTGREAVREAFEAAWQTFPDAAWLDGEHFVCGDRGVSETTFCGTKADGTRIEARMVDVFTFQDGKISVKNAFRKDRPPVAKPAN